MIENFYQILFDENPLPMWIFDADTMEFLAYNDSMIRHYGYSREELRGMTVPDLHPDRDIRRLKESIAALSSGQEYAGTWQHKKMDDTRIFVDIYLHQIKYEEKNACLVISDDITKRIAAEQNVRNLASIVEFSYDAIISTTLDGTILSWNNAAEKIFLYSFREMMGESVKKLFIDEEQNNILEILNRMKKKEEIKHFQTRCRTKEGKIIHLSLSVSPMRDSVNEIVAASIIARDMSDVVELYNKFIETSKQRESELRQYSILLRDAQDKERKRISLELHDNLGQRLSSIRLSTQMLSEEIPNKYKKVADGIKKIERDIDLSISEIRKLSANLFPSELEIFGLVPALTSLCKKYGKEMNIPIKYDFRDVQNIDKNISSAIYRIVQEALANISGHACATSVEIKLKYENNTINLFVVDNGKGFDANQVSLNKKTGHGLGIISMRERVESLGGLFQINAKPGSGTAIGVIIPLAHYETKKEN